MEYLKLSDDVRTFVARCTKMVGVLAETPMVYSDPNMGRFRDQRLADAEAVRCAALSVLSAANSALDRIDLRKGWAPVTPNPFGGGPVIFKTPSTA